MTALGLAHGGYLVPILGTLSLAGWNAESALASVGLRPDIAEHPAQTIPHLLAIRLIDEASHILGDEDFAPDALAEGLNITTEMVPARGVVCFSGPIQTLQSVVRILNRTTTSVFRLRETERDVWIDLHWTHGENNPPWSAELYVACLMINSFRGVLGSGWQPSKMKMLSTRRYNAGLSALPDCPIQWQAGTISVAVEKDDLARRLAASNSPHPDLPEVLISDLSEASAETVRAAIEGLLCHESIKLAEVANCFGLAQRSFQRRLDGLNLKFGDILDDFRITQAMRVLRQESVSVTDLALDLGYDHPQNFARAFRRRVGLSPRRYRNAL